MRKLDKIMGIIAQNPKSWIVIVVVLLLLGVVFNLIVYGGESENQTQSTPPGISSTEFDEEESAEKLAKDEELKYGNAYDYFFGDSQEDANSKDRENLPQIPEIPQSEFNMPEVPNNDISIPQMPENTIEFPEFEGYKSPTYPSFPEF